MRNSRTLTLLVAALAWGTAPPASSQVPVTDGALTSTDAVRNETTKQIEETDSRRHSVSKSVTCSMYRPGRGGDAPRQHKPIRRLSGS